MADLKSKSSDITLEKLQRMAEELMLPLRFALRVLNLVLNWITKVLAALLGSELLRRHFHLTLSALVLFGPLLSLWVSKFSIFANGNHFLYRKFLKSTWGWTLTLSGSFIVLLSLSARSSVSVCLRHLSRVGTAGLLWWGCRRLLMVLEDATGTCYQPIAQDGTAAAGGSLPPLLLLQEDQTKASCLKAHMVWRGYEVSQEVLILCLCCLLLVEELSVLGPHMAQAQSPPGAPLRVVFLLSVSLLAVWVFMLLCQLAHFPKFPAQQLGGALGYLGWKGLYQGWNRLGPQWGFPGLPGDGILQSEESEK